MKRVSIATIGIVLLGMGGYFVFAQDGPGMVKKDTMPKGMMGMGQMSPGCPMCGMKMQMGKPMLVATGDGSVVVAVGCQLLKYDKDLNLVKEAEIKIDMEKMKKKMEEMMKTCPMCSKMMQPGTSEKTTPEK